MRQKRTILFVDESGFYLLPREIRTWARRGHRQVLRERGSRRKEQPSAIAGIIPAGTLYTRCQREPFDSNGMVLFLQHLLSCIKDKLAIVRDESNIHRSEEVRASLRWVGRWAIELIRLPTYAPELNPTEGVWPPVRSWYLRNLPCHSWYQLTNLLPNSAIALSGQLDKIQSRFGQKGAYLQATLGAIAARSVYQCTCEALALR